MRSTAPLLLILATLLPACSNAPAPTTEEQQDSDSFLAAANGSLLHYRVRGTGSEVLLVPGGSWMLEDLEPLTKGRRVVSYDGRGRGRSDALAPNTPPTLEQDLADLDKVVEWFGLESFSMLAIDYQAALVAHYADKHPDKVERIVLASPLPISKEPYSAIYDRVFSERLDSRDFAELREMSRMLVQRRDPARWANAYKKALFTGWVEKASSLENMKSTPFVEPNIDPERALRQFEAIRRGLGNWDFREDLKSISCPVLVVYGSADPVPERSSLEWASTVKDGRAQRIENSGRLPWVEQPKEFFSVVSAFLDTPVAVDPPVAVEN